MLGHLSLRRSFSYPILELCRASRERPHVPTRINRRRLQSETVCCLSGKTGVDSAQVLDSIRRSALDTTRAFVLDGICNYVDTNL